jgi:hypothetical protein
VEFFDLPFTFSPFFAALSIKARSRSKNRVLLAGDRTYAACLQRIAVSAIFRNRRNDSISVSNSLRHSESASRMAVFIIINQELPIRIDREAETRCGKYQEIRTTPRNPSVGRSSPINPLSNLYFAGCSDMDLDNEEYPRVEPRSV